MSNNLCQGLLWDQVTIYDLDQLTDQGKALLAKVEQLPAKARIGEHSFDRSKTAGTTEDGLIKLCTWRNLHLVWQENGVSKRSSAIVFFNDRWCYTSSGSKYEFIGETRSSAPSSVDDHSSDRALE